MSASSSPIESKALCMPSKILSLTRLIFSIASIVGLAKPKDLIYCKAMVLIFSIRFLRFYYIFYFLLFWKRSSATSGATLGLHPPSSWRQRSKPFSLPHGPACYFPWLSSQWSRLSSWTISLCSQCISLKLHQTWLKGQLRKCSELQCSEEHCCSDRLWQNTNTNEWYIYLFASILILVLLIIILIPIRILILIHTNISYRGREGRREGGRVWEKTY